MTRRTILLGLLIVAAGRMASTSGAVATQVRPDDPIECSSCAAWNENREPFRIFGNTYYVGPAGLSALLITTAEGHILVDGALPQSAAEIDRNIRTLGFRTEDVRLILGSHAHFDHAGGFAALQRLSGAPVATSPAGVSALERGAPNPDDPQAAYGDGFPAVAITRAVDDGETLSVGDQSVTVHWTPGHTPGGTSWSWRSCEGDRCLDIVYADSLTAVSAPGFRFTGDAARPSIVDSFRRSIEVVRELPCDILVSTHPEFSDLFAKQARRVAGEPEALIDPQACRTYASNAAAAFERRIAEER